MSAKLPRPPYFDFEHFPAIFKHFDYDIWTKHNSRIKTKNFTMLPVTERLSINEPLSYERSFEEQGLDEAVIRNLFNYKNVL